MRNCVNGCCYAGPWKRIPEAMLEMYPNLDAKGITFVSVCQNPNASSDTRQTLDLYKTDDGKCYAGNGVAQIPWNDCVGFRR